jgi:hypothetical protein
VAELYKYQDNEWVIISYVCKYCSRLFKQERSWAAHEPECKIINTIKKSKSGDDMLIQRVTKGNQSFYRKGNDGKLYKTKEEAESGGSSGKKKGADGKACWEGYRYAGTKNGTDKCVKVKGR